MSNVSVGSVEDICNLALDAIGYRQAIGNIFEGTMAARVALRIYAPTRDAVMRAKDYTFAERFVAGSLNGQTAPPPWLYEYTYPSDCLRVRQVIPASPGTFPVLDPRPQLFSDYNDTRTSTPSKAILANISPATIIYTAQVTDWSTWDSNFVDALVASLARRFAIALRDIPQLVPAAEKLAQEAEDVANESQTNLPPSPMPMPRAQGGQGG